MTGSTRKPNSQSSSAEYPPPSQNMCHMFVGFPMVDWWGLVGAYLTHRDRSFAVKYIPANSLTFATKRAQRSFATFFYFNEWFCLAYTLEVQPTKQRIVDLGWSIWRIPDPTKGQSLVFGLPGHTESKILCVFFSQEKLGGGWVCEKNPCH